MRIISKFHDYYDAAQAEGQDRSLVYVRHHEDYHQLKVPANMEPFVKFGEANVPHGFEMRKQGKSIQVSFGLVLLAGKLYPFAKTEVRENWTSESTVYCFTREDLQERLNFFDCDLDGRDKKRTRWLFGGPSASTGAFFALTGSEALMDFAFAQQLPLLSWTSQRLEVNPALSGLQMYRHLNTWQVYQELSMFMGNLAAPDRVPVHIADKDRIAQHGFDKWSFRRMPQKD